MTLFPLNFFHPRHFYELFTFSKYFIYNYFKIKQKRRQNPINVCFRFMFTSEESSERRGKATHHPINIPRSHDPHYPHHLNPETQAQKG